MSTDVISLIKGHQCSAYPVGIRCVPSVLGVRVKNEKGYSNIPAAAVILATGGYGASLETLVN